MSINPIQYVKSGNSTVSVRSPSTFVWDLEDVSAPDAGRTEDGVMHKKRIGQVVKLELSWNNIPTSQASIILRLFNPEYVTVKYLDPMAGGFVETQFYVGNRSAPLYNATLGLWNNISFSIIDRRGAKK